MNTHPVPTRRRVILEAIIRIIDLFAYTAIFAGGIYALAFTPRTVQDELGGLSLIIVTWGGLLLLGGLVGFVGRLSRWWIIEVPATVASIFGIAIYFVVLGGSAFSNVSATVATVLIFCALLAAIRRWVELQIFATQPDANDFRTRLAAAIRRRTQNAVSRNN